MPPTRRHTRRADATEDALTLYLRDMRAAANAHPLLTREEERALIRRIQAGMVDTPGKMDQDLPADADARVALDEFMSANLRLVVPYAVRAANHARKLDVLDYIQAGNLGMLRAIGTFDLSRRYRFSTYATWWIRQFIAREGQDHGRTIRLPAHRQEGHHPHAVHDAEGRLVLPPDAFSLDMVVDTNNHSGTEHASTLKDLVPAPGDMADEVAEAVTQQQEAAGLRALLAGILSPMECAVIARRYGLDGGTGATLEVVGRALGVTRERGRQIEAKALEKLRRVLTQDSEGNAAIREGVARMLHAQRDQRAALQAENEAKAEAKRERERERAKKQHKAKGAA